MTTDTHTRLKHRKQLKIWNGLFFPTHHKPTSDLHLFGALKGAIRGKSFGSDAAASEELRKWLTVRNSH
jgi:hypothetical protein